MYTDAIFYNPSGIFQQLISLCQIFTQSFAISSTPQHDTNSPGMYSDNYASMVPQTYVANSFRRVLKGTYSTTTANISGIRSFCLNQYNGSGYPIGHRFVFDEGQIKDNMHTLTLNFEITVLRDLS